MMTFPIEERINTELFFDGNKELCIQKVDKETDKENILIRKKGSRKITELLEEGKTEIAGMKIRRPVWNDLL